MTITALDGFSEAFAENLANLKASRSYDQVGLKNKISSWGRFGKWA